MLRIFLGFFILTLSAYIDCATDPNDLKVLNDFKNGLKNPELLKWPENGNDPCGPPKWDHVFCSNDRVTQIQVQGLGLEGTLPQNLNQLGMLENLGLQRNKFYGKMPTFSGLSNLQYAFLDFNRLDTIPFDFFRGLTSVQVLALDENPFNQTSGWALPADLAECTQLVNFSCSQCNTKPGEPCSPEVSALLEFLGELGYPLQLASLWSGNDPCEQSWRGISCNSMGKVTVINLQHLGLNGTLSPSLANLSSLREIHLEGNNIHGTVPADLTRLSFLRVLNLNGNNFDKPLPQFHGNVTVVTTGNAKFESRDGPVPAPSPPNSSDSPNNNSNSNAPAGEVNRRRPDSPSSGIPSLNSSGAVNGPSPEKSRITTMAAAAAGSTVLLALVAVLFICCLRRRKKLAKNAPARVASHKDSLKDPDNSNNNSMFKIGFMDGGPASEALRASSAGSRASYGPDSIELGSPSISVHVLRKGDERLLVYEYMPQGALSQHLFRWKSLGLEPLSWTSRLYIALDVARGVEYLHSLAHHSFIHRDLKSANILLDDEFRAKVSDFGLVKLAPDREMSMATRLAGTFGYLAPEYAVTGKITTKVDVFSFGVVLMELLTGLAALDEQRPEEKRYLAEWFWQIKSKKDSLIASVDPALNAEEDIHESIHLIATLAGHCTARDPNHRPEMGHAVSVLAQLVERWRPHEDIDRESGVSMDLPLSQMLKGWQQEEEGLTRDYSYASQDSKGSIPTKPSGFADSFTSADAR
ncbi:Leucine-rich repeat protein kinase family protein [Striga hermonthica]|uniref:Leucine-rich repeat protein kinase family protein n=1 Tax=Striga hermonthica TaxID=68872 RepID=A0A9N7REF5_STRHE|nr:Leucine-rich repeat protein kinase family protein [Striga hermonthica]